MGASASLCQATSTQTAPIIDEQPPSSDRTDHQSSATKITKKKGKITGFSFRDLFKMGDLRASPRALNPTTNCAHPSMEETCGEIIQNTYLRHWL
jgi:hypothetical protein